MLKSFNKYKLLKELLFKNVYVLVNDHHRDFGRWGHQDMG